MDRAQGRKSRVIPTDDARGMFLLAALWVNVLLLLAMVGLAPSFLTTTRTVSLSHSRQQALAIAEAGITRAQWELRNAPNNFNNAALWTQLAATACDDELDGGTDGNLYGMAVVSCHSLALANPARTITSSDGTNTAIGTMSVWVVNMNAPPVRIISQGSIPNIISATRTIRCDLEGGGTGSTFKYVAFAGGRIYLGNVGKVQIDSYDSRKGAYGAATGPPVKGKTPVNIYSNAKIGTNGTSGGTVLWNPNPNLTVNGTAYKLTGTTHYIHPRSTVTGGVQEQPSYELPDITVPSNLQALPKSTGNLTDGDGRVLTDMGGYHTTYGDGVWTCDRPYHLNGLYVTGEFRMTNNCQLFVDRATTGSPWAGALDTSAHGRLLKTGTGVNQIYTRNGFVNLDAQGISWDTVNISAADRKPEKLQLYVDCPSGCDTLVLAQSTPFYGVVYAKGVNAMGFGYGNEYGVLSDGNFYGAFITTAPMEVNGVDSQQLTAYVHYDEALANLLLDAGLGAGHRIIPGSWIVK